MAGGPVGIVEDLTVFPEAEARDSLERATPAQFLHRLLAISTDDGIHAGAGDEPVLGILRHVPATQEDKGSFRHGPDLPTDEFDIAFPVNRETDKVGLGTAEIDGAAGALTEIHNLQRLAARLQNGRDQLKPQGRKESGVEPVAVVGVDAKDMVIHRYTSPDATSSVVFLNSPIIWSMFLADSESFGGAKTIKPIVLRFYIMLHNKYNHFLYLYEFEKA